MTALAAAGHPQPIDDALFEWPPIDGTSLLRLAAGECSGCQLVMFPRQADCPRCMGDAVQPRPLSPRGTLWTFTTQGYRPKTPPFLDSGDSEFEPFAVGYLELDGVVRVEGRITGDPADLRIGIEMDVVTLRLPAGAGAEVITFAFQPVALTNGKDS